MNVTKNSRLARGSEHILHDKSNDKSAFYGHIFVPLVCLTLCEKKVPGHFCFHKIFSPFVCNERFRKRFSVMGQWF